MLGPSASEVHARWLDAVGNLTLSGYNPVLSDRGFEEKGQLRANRTSLLAKVFRITESGMGKGFKIELGH
jgi:hypothetical protein